jgi:hypothetical protein
MNKKAGVAPLKTPAKILKEAAVERIAALPIAKVRPEKYRQAESKASREATLAVGQKDFAAAAAANQRQMLNHYMYREAIRVRDESQKIRTYLTSFNRKKKRAAIGKAGEQYLDAIDIILEGTSFRQRSLRGLEKLDSLAEFITSLEAAGEPVVVPQKLRDEANLENYKNMTIDELRGMRDGIKNLDHLARFKNKLKSKAQEREIQSVVQQIRDRAEAISKRKDADNWQNPEGIEKGLNGLRWVSASLTKVEFVLKWLDGEVAGLAHEHLFQPIADAQNAAHDMRKEMHEKIFKPLEKMPKGQKARWNSKVNFLGQKMRGRDVIAVALNMGNEGNIARLTDGYEDRGWTEEKVRDALNDWMTKEDWDTVQMIWDEINVMYQPLSDVKQRLTGIRPPKVEAMSFETPHGTYEGGYYPIVYDENRSYEADVHNQSKTALFENNYFRPEATASASEARVAGTVRRPLKLNIDILGQHIFENIHFITHAEAVFNADKLVQHPDFRAVVTEQMGSAVYKRLRPWLQTIANDAVALEEQSMVDPMIRYLQGGVSIVAMGFNLGTSAMQLFGTFTTIDAIGPKYWMRGLSRSYAGLGYDWKKVAEHWKYADEKSGELRHLTSVFDRDIRNLSDQAFGKLGPSRFLGILGIEKAKIKRFQQSAFLPIAYVQKTVNQATWWGAYEKAIDEGRDEQGAINFADAIVRQSQSGGGTKDLAAIQRGGPAKQTLALFYTFFSVLYNRLEDVVRVSGMQKKSVPEMAARLAVLLVIPAMFEGWARDEGPDEDEEEEYLWWLAKRVALYGITTLPLVRDVVNGYLGEFGYNYSPIGTGLNTAVRALKSIEKYREEGELTDSQMKALVKTFGLFMKLPVSSIFKAYQYNKKLEEEGFESTKEKVSEAIFGVRKD